MHTVRPEKISFERRNFEETWYPDTTAPRFFIEPFRIQAGSLARAEVFSGVEIDVVRSGSGELYLDGIRFAAEPGDILYYDCMIPHRHEPRAGTLELLGVHAQLAALIGASPVQGDMRLYEPFVALRAGGSPVVHGAPELAAALERTWQHCSARNTNWDLAAWHEVTGILCAIRARYDSSARDGAAAAPPGERTLVMRALAFIEEHATEPIGLDEIARACGCSVSSLSHRFAEVMNTSPIDYRNRQRVVRAVERITQTSESLNRICFDVGFASLSQFYDLFKRLTGQTPASLRRP